MTGPVEVLNAAVSFGVLGALVVVGRRPARRWRAGRAGKLISLAAVLVVAFHVGDLLVPLGAGIAVARHRHDPHDSSLVPPADTWPGA